jgi:hypothetical protein
MRARLTYGHYAAMSYRDVSTFVVKLQSQEGIAARALEFLILTATRAGEALGGRSLISNTPCGQYHRYA